MRENKSELAFGFVNLQTFTFPELPSKYGTITLETVAFDYSTGKFAAVQRHSLGNVTRKESPRMFENDSPFTNYKESDLGFKTVLD